MENNTVEKLTVSAVIPAYFEESTIGEVVKMTLPFVDEVLVVDDGSTDETTKNAVESGARVVRLEKNTGYLQALQRGLREARGDIIVTLDADGQHVPSEIHKLIEPIIKGKADLVMGTRPSIPYFSEQILTWMTNLRVPVKDASTGFRAIKREIALKMNLHGKCTCGTFVLEAHHHGAQIKDVPITIKERQDERRLQSNHFSQFFIVLWDVLRY